MKRLSRYFFIFSLISLLLLSACWDQRLLRDHSLVLTIGYDTTEENQLKKTVTFPKNTNGNTTLEQAATTQSSTLTAVADTVKDTEKKMDRQISEKFDRSKTRVIIFGEELAKKGIVSTLDSVYRDLRGPLHANIAIYQGEAEDALNIKSEQAPMISDIYNELLDSSEQAGITKNKAVQMAYPIMLAKGKDLVLPYLSFDKEKNEATIEGVALFFKDKMTGTLSTEETTMYLLLSNQLAKYTELNVKFQDDKQESNQEHINISIRKNKRKVNIEATPDNIYATIHSKIIVEVEEFAEDSLGDPKKVGKLENKIEEQLEELANETITKMQKANSDALELGQRVKAYHYDTWQKINWIEDYPEIDIDVKFDVNIYQHGTIF